MTTPCNDTMHMVILGKTPYSLVINYLIGVHKFFLWIVMGMLHHIKNKSHNEMMTFYHKFLFYVSTSMLRLTK
jgi:hypothetical protein